LAALAVPATAAAAAHRPSAGDSSLPNLTRASTRAQPGSPIRPSSVAHLHLLWRFPLAASRSVHATGEMRTLVATPIVAGATVYIQDTTSSVYALERATGALRWRHRFAAPNAGRNGLAYSSGSVYGATDTTAFALSAATGRLLWQRRLVTRFEQLVDVAPLIANNLVYTSTVGYPPGGRGAIYALDAHTGAVRWKFSTIAGRWRYPGEAGGGGAWYTASLDEAGNLYSGVANPYPLGGSRKRPNGAAYAGPALYTDSLVVLDSQTGRLRWYDQVTAHDVRDHDFQLPPILASLSVGKRVRNVVFGAGKAGIVIAWDRETHQRLWQAVVGRHLNDAGPLPARKVAVCPGLLGGVETPMAYAAGRLFVPIVDSCSYGSAYGYQPLHTLNLARGRGEFVALDATSGRVLWEHALPQPDVGCATAANGVVFTSTFDGQIYGLDQESGRTLWRARAPAGINACPSLSGGMLLVAAGSATSEMPHPRFALLAYALR
jgi:alcohol dehydrogenase (cytochrome c)